MTENKSPETETRNKSSLDKLLDKGRAPEAIPEKNPQTGGVDAPPPAVEDNTKHPKPGDAPVQDEPKAPLPGNDPSNRGNMNVQGQQATQAQAAAQSNPNHNHFLTGAPEKRRRQWSKDENEQLVIYLRDTHTISELLAKVNGSFKERGEAPLTESDLWDHMDQIAWERKRFKDLREALTR